MWSAVFDQTSCEFNAFLHVSSYMCHECYMKSQIITQADVVGVFFLILYTTSVFVASVCGRSFSSVTVLLRDLTLNLQPSDQEKCVSVLFCKPNSCCDYILDNLSQKRHFLLPRTPLETPTFYFTLSDWWLTIKYPDVKYWYFLFEARVGGGGLGWENLDGFQSKTKSQDWCILMICNIRKWRFS